MKTLDKFLSVALASSLLLSSITATFAQETPLPDLPPQGEPVPTVNAPEELLQYRFYLPLVGAPAGITVEQDAPEETQNHSEVVQSSVHSLRNLAKRRIH